MSFEKNLKDGQIGESYIANFLKSKGYSVLPVYEKEIDNGKGPRIFSLIEELVAPDMFIFNSKKTMWIEAKHKTAFAYFRKLKIWTTGINLTHWRDYCKLSNYSEFDFWVMFLHKGGTAKDSPPSESGLFGQDIKVLKDKVNHISNKTKMVYWDKNDLIKIADYTECF